MDDEDFGQVDEEILEPGAQKGVPLSEYVLMDGPRQALRKTFHEFLTQFVDSAGKSVYGERIKRMCECTVPVAHATNDPLPLTLAPNNSQCRVP